MGDKVSVDGLADAVVSALKEYGNVTIDVLEAAVEKTTKETVKQIKANAASTFKGTGKYAKSWSSKKQAKGGRGTYGRVIYAKPPYYRLTHLLENGHAKVNGGRVEGRAHIAPAEEAAKEMLISEIKSGISKG